MDLLDLKQMNGTTSGTRYERSLNRDLKKECGVYYTPIFLAHYVVGRTCGLLLEECASVDDVLKIRIYDPACGSGNFLMASFDYLVHWCKVRFGEPSAKLMVRIQQECLFGSDIDAAALAIARSELPYANFVCADALPPYVPCFAGRFDIIIGNPPYGAQTGGRGDSARLFMRRAHELLQANGLHAFVVPKSLLYSSAWRSTLGLFMAGIYEIVDCGKVWPDVKLEQVIYFYSGAARTRASSYRSCLLTGEKVQDIGALDHASFSEFGFALNGISNQELSIGRRMRSSAASLHDFIENRRGAPLQSSLTPKTRTGAMAVLGGKQIERYGLASKPKGFFAPRSEAGLLTDKRAVIKPGAILVQNIVAHVSRPEPHLKITATLAPSGRQALIVDTVNQLTNKSRHAPEFILGILNSKIIAWYIYRFVVGRAIRTIHFDSPLTSRIPMPAVIEPKLHDTLVVLVREMLERRSESVDQEIDLLVLRLFGLEKGGGAGSQGIGVLGV